MKSSVISFAPSVRQCMSAAATLMLGLCAIGSSLSANAGTKPATLSGSSSMVGNLFVPATSPQTVIPVASTGPAAASIPPVILNTVAPGQGTYAVITPSAIGPMGVVFGSSAASPNAVNVINSFNSNVAALMPQLNSVNVVIGNNAAPINLGSAVQSTLSSPSQTSILSALQLTLMAVQQNPNNPAVQQFASQLYGTYSAVMNMR